MHWREIRGWGSQERRSGWARLKKVGQGGGMGHEGVREESLGASTARMGAGVGGRWRVHPRAGRGLGGGLDGVGGRKAARWQAGGGEIGRAHV